MDANGNVVLENFTWLEPDEDEQDNEINLLLTRLDETWQASLDMCGRSKQELVEIFLQLGRRPKATFDDGIRKDALFLTESECCTRQHLDKFMESIQWRDHIRSFKSKCMCIPETLHRINMITKGEGDRPSDMVLIGMNVRVGRSAVGSISQMCPWIITGRQFLGKENYPPLNLARKSILFIGRPGAGKTTILREIAHSLSCISDDGIVSEKTVVVVDKVNEIAGNNDMPHVCIGEARWMPCGNPDLQSQILREAIQNTTPDVVLVDEISDPAEVEAVRTIIGRGASLIATVHGSHLTDILACKTRHVLLGGVQDKKRLHKPLFDVAIEIHQWDAWILHPNVQKAVDACLRGQNIEAIELKPGVASATVGIPVSGAWDYCCKCASHACPLHESRSGRTPPAGRLCHTPNNSRGIQKTSPHSSHSSSSPYRPMRTESLDRTVMRSSTPPRRKRTPPPFNSTSQRESSRTAADSRAGAKRTPRSNQVTADRRVHLSPEELVQIGTRIKAATYAMNNNQLDVLFNKLDPDRSGCMTREDLRRALRKILKISPSIVTDFEVDEVCSAIGDEDFGLIGIRDFKAFIGLEPALAQQTANTPTNFAASTGNSTYSSDISPRKAERPKTPPGGNLFTIFKKRGPILTEEAVDSIRGKMRKEIQSSVGGRHLAAVFGRFDRDGTGRLQDDEVRLCLRRALRISPTSLSDADIYSACAAIDVDHAGSVRIDDLVSFAGSQRDGRRMPWEPR